MLEDSYYSLYKRLPAWSQTAALSAYGTLLTYRRYGPGYRSVLRDVLEHGTWTRDKVLHLQSQRIHSLLAHSFSTISYYRNIATDLGLSVNDFVTADSLRQLPLLSKRDVRANSDRLLSSDLGSRQIVAVSTSGSTGMQLRLVFDRSAQQEQWAVWWRYRMKFGLTNEIWCGCFAGRVIVPAATREPPFWRINYPARQVLYSAYHMSTEFLSYYVRSIKERQLQWIHGYPSTIGVLAKYIVEHGITLKMRWVTVGAESMSLSQKRLIERAFGCRCYQHYGCVEGVANLSECEEGNMHADEDVCAVELLPTAEPTRYTIAGTNLCNHAMPLIRYDTGDVCGPPILRCGCGRGSLCVSRVTGRRNDFVVLKDGRMVSTLDEVFEVAPNVYQAQIVQYDPGKILVRIVVAPEWTKNDEQLLMRGFERRVGALLDVSFEYTDTLSRTEQGKVRMVISRCTDNEVEVN